MASNKILFSFYGFRGPSVRQICVSNVPKNKCYQTIPWFCCWTVFFWWHGHAFISAINLRHPKHRLSLGQLSLSSETTVSYLRDLFLYRFVTNISNQQVFALWYFWHSNWGWNQSLLFGRFFNLLTSFGFYGSNFSKVDSKLFKVGALILAKTRIEKSFLMNFEQSECYSGCLLTAYSDYGYYNQLL